jgi:3',5'-cyclic AMP phosphodiesterase CpdA
MSSLWTPGGEHEVPRQPSPASAPPPSGAEDPQVLEVDPETAAALEAMSPEERAQAEQMIAEMAQARAEIAHTPAAVVVANHAMGLYELAAIHLSQQPPNLSEAGVAVDALAALVGALRGRLGDNEATLEQALNQLQMAFVELTRRAQAGEGTAGGETGAAG